MLVPKDTRGSLVRTVTLVTQGPVVDSTWECVSCVSATATQATVTQRQASAGTVATIRRELTVKSAHVVTMETPPVALSTIARNAHVR